MEYPKTKEGLLTERDSWEAIINSPHWVTYRRFLKEHVAYLQKEANTFLRAQKFTEAYGKLIAMDDSEKILTLITVRLSEINRLIEQGG